MWAFSREKGNAGYRRSGALRRSKEWIHMSQAKVDRYKEEKRNRKKIMAREKRNWRLMQAGLGAVCVAIVAWVGISAYQALQPADDAAAEVKTYTVDNSALDDYIASLTEE